MSNGMKSERNDLLNHAVKAIKYRLERATLGSLENFGEFKVGQHTHIPFKIPCLTWTLIGTFSCGFLVHFGRAIEIPRIR